MKIQLNNYQITTIVLQLLIAKCVFFYFEVKNDWVAKDEKGRNNK